MDGGNSRGSALRVPPSPFPRGRPSGRYRERRRSRVTALTHSPAVEALLRSLHHRGRCGGTCHPGHRLLEEGDAARWGRLRYAVLMDVEGAASDGRDLCLVDIKEAIKAVAPRHQSASMPRDNGRRVVEGARAMSPFLGERMAAGRLADRSVFVRELLPRPEVSSRSNSSDAVAEAVKAAYYLARVVGAAHARQMDSGTRNRWHAEPRSSSFAGSGCADMALAERHRLGGIPRKGLPRAPRRRFSTGTRLISEFRAALRAGTAWPQTPTPCATHRVRARH